MRKFIASLFLAGAAAGATASAAEIITTPPTGSAVEYYADFENYDNLFGYMGDYHSTQTIVFTDNDEVYFPNLLLRRTMKGYVKGIYDKSAQTITVAPGQCLFTFPNEDIDVGLFVLDSHDRAGATPATFYTEPLIFDVADNGIITLRSSEQFPAFGLCNTKNSEEVYQNARDLRFVPVADITPKVNYYDQTYIFDNEDTPTISTVAAYKENDDIIWVKGFDPKYPDIWIKVSRGEEGFEVVSFQVLQYFANESPVVIAATDGTNLHKTIPVEVDEATLDMSTPPDLQLCNVLSEENYMTLLWTFRNVCITGGNYGIVKPAAPLFVEYSAPNSSGETGFTFDSYATGIEGDNLVRDLLAFRMYTDGEPYVFTTENYRWADTDMATVPYNFSNYNFFSIGGDDKQRRYVYLQNLPADTKTIGVELVYTIEGAEVVSDRLVYNIAAGTADYEMAGIADIGTSIREAVSAEYFDMLGRPAGPNFRGPVVRITRYTDGSVSAAKIVR